MRKLNQSLPNRRRVLQAGASALVLGVPGLAIQTASAQPQQNTLIIGHTTTRHLNPAIQSGQATGVPGVQLFAGLVRLDDKFQPQPYLARSWEISKDGLVYTFALESNASFHDGTPITADDVAFSIELVKANHPFGRSMYQALEKIQIPNKTTLSLHLTHPQPALLTALSPLLTPILPKHIYSNGPIQTNPANINVIGSGPFKLVQYEADRQIVMERNPNFFRSGRPYMEKLIFRINREPLTNILLMERGETHYLPFAGIRMPDLAKIEVNPNLKLTTKGYEALGATNYIEINHRRPGLSDRRVRQAIAHAIDKDFITKKLLAGKAERLDGPLTHSNVFFNQSSLHIYEYNLQKAAKLLDEAGYPADKSGTRLRFTLRWLPDVNVNSQEPVAQYVKIQLKKIGIDITLQPSPDFPTWSSSISNWEYDLTMNGMWNYPDPVIGVNRAYLSDNMKKGVIYSNTEGYANKEVDSILTQAAIEGDFAKRKGLYEKFQSIVTDDLPLVWTNEEPLFTIYNPNLENLPLTVWGALAPYDEVRWKST